MARKDNKGRNLKTGEYQRPDGRYEYRYKDEITGKRNSVYAADLVSLREMEKKINKDMDDLLITDASVILSGIVKQCQICCKCRKFVVKK